MQIRRLTEKFARDHASDLLRLGGDLVWHAWTQDQLLAERDDKWYRSIVAVDADGEPLGYAVVSRSTGGAHLHQIIVGAEHRSLGIGGALMERLTRDARRDGLRCVTLKVLCGNHRAILFYERAGFRRMGADNAGQAFMELDFPEGGML